MGWRAAALAVLGMLAIACQAPTPPPVDVPFEPAGSTSFGFPSGAAARGRVGEERTALRAAPPRPREEPFDRRLLPPPAIGPWQPMEAEALLFAADAPVTQEPEAGQSQGSEHWSGLPFMSDLARDHGIQLPEPLGLSVNYVAINRPSRVDRVRAGVNGGDLVELPSLAFEAEAKVQIVISRLDAWVLPMLNVYVLGGYVWNQSSVDLTVDLPGAPNTAFQANGNLEGPTYGFGATFAGGYGNYFMVADLNWNKVELGGLSEMDARLLTARVGYRNSQLGWAEELRVYFATTYWDTARTIAGSLQLMGGPISSIEYAVDQSPVDSLTLGVGTHVQLDRNWGAVLEVQGYDETLYFVGGFTLRF